jgi:hypothetical protein
MSVPPLLVPKTPSQQNLLYFKTILRLQLFHPTQKILSFKKPMIAIRLYIFHEEINIYFSWTDSLPFSKLACSMSTSAFRIFTLVETIKAGQFLPH